MAMLGQAGLSATERVERCLRPDPPYCGGMGYSLPGPRPPSMYLVKIGRCPKARTSEVPVHDLRAIPRLNAVQALVRRSPQSHPAQLARRMASEPLIIPPSAQSPTSRP